RGIGIGSGSSCTGLGKRGEGTLVPARKGICGRDGDTDREHGQKGRTAVWVHPWGGTGLPIAIRACGELPIRTQCGHIEGRGLQVHWQGLRTSKTTPPLPYLQLCRARGFSREKVQTVGQIALFQKECTGTGTRKGKRQRAEFSTVRGPTQKKAPYSGRGR